MHRDDLLILLERYRTPFMEEAAMVERTRRFVRAHVNCFDRNPGPEPGHVTASSWVVNPARSHVLMLHHRKLDRWLQPGGHADGLTDVLHAALKETEEETGAEPGRIRILSPEIFDVDIHVIYPTTKDVRHEHFDIRFLLEIDDAAPLPGNHESYDLGWVPLEDVPRFNNDLSIYRMVKKTRNLARP
jgi:8-oxo-dGTP pyrophosphatase MutT (NUDIX family)